MSSGPYAGLKEMGRVSDNHRVMDRRREPRLENYTAVKLRPLNRSDLKLECVIVDSSETGMRIVAPESLPENTIIGLEFSGEIVLASVCRSQPFGDQYALGAQRVHTISNAAPIRKKAEIQQIRAAIEEFRERKRAARPEADSPAAFSEEDLTQLDQQLQEYFEQRQLAPAGPKTRKRADVVKSILDRINRVDHPKESKPAGPSLVRLSEVPSPEPDEAASPVPMLLEKKSNVGKCSLPSWFMASLNRPHS